MPACPLALAAALGRALAAVSSRLSPAERAALAASPEPCRALLLLAAGSAADDALGADPAAHEACWDAHEAALGL